MVRRGGVPGRIVRVADDVLPEGVEAVVDVREAFALVRAGVVFHVRRPDVFLAAQRSRLVVPKNR